MKFEDLYVYIAAPFFNEKQVKVVKDIENVLEMHEIKYFSPRKEGVIKENNSLNLEDIYKSNIKHLEGCNFMIAVIDDYDTGTTWELGYFTSIKDNMLLYKSFIVTLTEKGYGLNVMLKFGTDCHLKSIDSLYFMLKELKGSQSQIHILKKYDREVKVAT